MTQQIKRVRGRRLSATRSNRPIAVYIPEVGDQGRSYGRLSGTTTLDRRRSSSAQRSGG